MFTTIFFLRLLAYFMVTTLPSLYIFNKLISSSDSMTLKRGAAMAVAYAHVIGFVILMIYLSYHPLVAR